LVLPCSFSRLRSSHQWIRCNCQQKSPLTSRVKMNTVPCQQNLLFSVSSTCSTCDLQPKCDQVHIASVAASLHVEVTAIHLGTFFSTDITWGATTVPWIVWSRIRSNCPISALLAQSELATCSLVYYFWDLLKTIHLDMLSISKHCWWSTDGLSFLFIVWSERSNDRNVTEHCLWQWCCGLPLEVALSNSQQWEQQLASMESTAWCNNINPYDAGTDLPLHEVIWPSSLE